MNSVIGPSAFAWVWGAWLAYWILLAFNVKVTERRESMRERAFYTLPLALGLWQFTLDDSRWPVLGWHWVAGSVWTWWSGMAATIVGLAFAVWARHCIGRNWSGSVTLKKDHELITTGPYAMVRHPIYTGILLAASGSALAAGDVAALVALALFIGSFLYKLRVEEAWMRERFGERYVEYCRTTPALIPRRFTLG